MKQVLLLLLLTGYLGWGQDSMSVRVIARSLPEKVMLRWAVNEPFAWKKANENGFFVERSTISRNGEAVVPIERKMLSSAPLKPKPLEEWATLAQQDQNVAVLAQALYGSSFETTTPASGTLGKISAINDELEQRFTFGLLAAEQSFEGALLAGWGLVDDSVIAGEKYLYKVSVALPPEASLRIQEGSVFAGPDLFEVLPKPIGLAGIFTDSNVTLSWNFDLLSATYTSYEVERSEDNQSFEPQNRQPLFNASPDEGNDEIALFYTDSIPNNKTFYYRIKGKTAFGETGPASESVSGKAQKASQFVPRIYRKEIPTDNSVRLFWEFEEEGNDDISNFRLARGNTDRGPFETVRDDIPVTTRQITVEGLKRINYFTITAVAKNGDESESYPAMVQPVDSLPPSPPKEIRAEMDTTGIITLSWAKNPEDDLSGYRIFKSNNPKVEFSELTQRTLIGETYSDTVRASSLNKKIYYKLKAEDQRYNRSEFSEVITVEMPDNIPPSPPVLKKYKVTMDGIRILWIPSSSEDVASHAVYRTNGTSQEKQWEKVFESTSRKDTVFLDEEDLTPNSYSYTIVALDSTGLESAPSDPLTVTWNGRPLAEKDIKFTGTVNRELRFINLSWRVKNTEVMEYQLYRAKNGGDLKLYKTLDGSTKGYNDVDLEINTEYTYGIQLILGGGRKNSSMQKIFLQY